jgi:phage-related minor tail protein
MPDHELDDAAQVVDQLSHQMKALDGVTQQFGRSLSRALSGGIVQGKGFEDILRNIGQRFIDIALRAAFKPLETGFSSLASSLFAGLGQAAGGLGGSLGSVMPFADGGVISTPHYFPLARGLTGLAGERGAEAIMPLARGPDGRLGVAANGGSRAPVTIHMTVSTPDAESFRRGEAQVSAALARAVARGQRNL